MPLQDKPPGVAYLEEVVLLSFQPGKLTARSMKVPSRVSSHVLLW